MSELIKYCTRCVFYIPYSKALGIEKKAFITHICGSSLRIFTNVLGIKEYVKYGDLQTCEECGQVTQDNREIRTQKCINKNKKLRCKEFKATLKWLIPCYILKLIANIKERKAESKRRRIK